MTPRRMLAQAAVAAALITVPLTASAIPAWAAPETGSAGSGQTVDCESAEHRDECEQAWRNEQARRDREARDWANNLNNPANPMSPLNPNNPANPNSPNNPRYQWEHSLNNPANPMSPLNPNNPANPNSPLNPNNQHRPNNS